MKFKVSFFFRLQASVGNDNSSEGNQVGNFMMEKLRRRKNLNKMIFFLTLRIIFWLNDFAEQEIRNLCRFNPVDS